jgi:hypothetical protein
MTIANSQLTTRKVTLTLDRQVLALDDIIDNGHTTVILWLLPLENAGNLEYIMN